MPSNFFRGYVQDVTWWEATGVDGYGNRTFAAPVTKKGRWADKAEEFQSPTGETLVSRSIVYLQEDVSIGDYLLLGTSVTAIPTNEDLAYPVRQHITVPDLRNLRSERRAIL